MSSLHGHAGVHFDVKGWSPKIDMEISEEPENQRVFLDHEIHKKMLFIQSRLYMVMQGCSLMLRIGAQKSIETFLRSLKIARYSGVILFVQNVFF